MMRKCDGFRRGNRVMKGLIIGDFMDGSFYELLRLGMYSFGMFRYEIEWDRMER